jgi:transposase InsO family protein
VCADAFIATWVTRYGVPATVTTDRGRQFSLAVWSTLCQRLNIQHIETTAYHPQSNRMVERTHCSSKTRYGRSWPASGGQNTSLGCYWTSEPRPRRTAASPQLSWCSACLSRYLASS